MSKSLHDCLEEVRNHEAKFSDFPVGTKVRIVTFYEDEYFFKGTETGTVIKNEGKYLSITVKFDVPRHFEDGYIQTSFNFNPHSLRVTQDLSFDTLSRPYPFGTE